MILFFLLSFVCAVVACPYGEEPGTWTHTEWAELPSRGTTLDYFRLDDSKHSVWLSRSQEPAGVPFGSAWKLLSPHCQLRNILNEYLVTTAPLPLITVALLGDSNDEHLLDFLCMEYHARHGKGRWAAYVHSHRTINYCVVDSGLFLVQMYSTSIETEDILANVASMRKFFDGDDSEAYARWDGWPETNSTPIGRDAEVRKVMGREPDVVVVSNTYWALNNYLLSNENDKLVHMHFLSKYTHAMHALVRAASDAFVRSKIGVRSSHQVRSNCDDGDTTRRAWGKRAWVAQINAAMRPVVQTERRRGRLIHLFDTEVMASAFTPAQTTSDDIHYRAWLGMELLNVYLNAAGS